MFSVLPAVAGGIIIKYRQPGSEEPRIGITLMQAANLCFAFGHIFIVEQWQHCRIARRTSAGSPAVFNNLKIPIGILVSVLIFHKKANWLRLFGGGLLMIIALVLNKYRRK
ncbi:hypothetical protein [Tichowtungia aerotolerans]|uniref:EamA domain-containing protein n=1 Tax=Tichowtungia aerotolerans TaxID=2697043 RepID=A0A6P1MA46_9BACT|nr:hypothetical protein [Tichowtungia aerotolerans]QHI69953.1 hypothetical protein GT409_10985 [Tichowtungia aerotolerans]